MLPVYFLCLFHYVLVFYAIQQVAQAGWSPVLFRVMQGITSIYLLVHYFVILILWFHFNHLFIWFECPEGS
jgi:hypothetical protein